MIASCNVSCVVVVVVVAAAAIDAVVLNLFKHLYVVTWITSLIFPGISR